MTNSNKKILIFFLVAFAFNYLMAIPMYFGFRAEYDLSVFPVAQMMYPACGVILAKLICDSEDMKLPRGAYITTLLFTLCMVILSFVSLFCPLDAIEVNGLTVEMYAVYSQYIMMVFSIIVYILFWTCKKERRINAGLERKNIKMSILMVLLYVALYALRILLSCVIDQVTEGTGWASLAEIANNFTDPQVLLTFVTLPISFFFAFLAFFGEEYGWRYFLQGELMSKFGKRKGVLILGVLWGLWHMPLDFMYYTRDSGLQMLVNQIFVCIGFSIFFAYAYMKTENMWVPITMHFINNNLIPVITGNLSTDTLENRSLSWSSVFFSAVLTLIYVGFIFTKEFNENKIEEA